MGNSTQHLESLIGRYPELEGVRERIYAAFGILKDTFTGGGKLLIAGNGGSSADADHIVGELVKEFKKKRPLPLGVRKAILDRCGAEGAYLAENLQGGLPALSLAAHTAFLTAFSNDSKPNLAFAQQVHALGRPGDCLLAISTSGNSANVVYAAMVAKSVGLKVIGLTGRTGGNLAAHSDVLIPVPEGETDKVQELHQPIYHTLCAMVEEEFF